MSAVRKVAVVTGANKGIGKAVIEGLLEKTSNTIIYLTARDTTRGNATLHELLPVAELTSNTLKFAQLDVTCDASTKAFYESLKSDHANVDIIINNAGVFEGELEQVSNLDEAKFTLGVNYYGVKRVLETLKPLLHSGSRVVNVASTLGVMKGGYVTYPEDRIKQLSTAQNVSDVDRFVEEYLELVAAGKAVEEGFPKNAYSVSKSAVIAYSVVQARELEVKGVYVNAMCPGYVATDMTKHAGHRTPAQGADTAVFLATDPDVQFNGVFVFDREQKAWY
uniref:Carbonyl reductase n=1 Tax=Panagrellus redivivus TaxID=6233 RepID=A0A7E4VLK2_PANRE